VLICEISDAGDDLQLVKDLRGVASDSADSSSS